MATTAPATTRRSRRHRPSTIGALATSALLLFGACGGDDGSDTTTPASTSVPDSTAAPTTAPTSAPTPDSTTTTIPRELGERLISTEEITAAGLGDGWSDRRREAFDERGPELPPLPITSWCPDAPDLTELTDLAGDSGAIAEIDQELPTARGYHGVSEQVWSNGDATDFLAAVRALVDACMDTNYSVDDPEGGEEDVQISVMSLTSPSIGDESVSVRADAVQPGPEGAFRWASRMIVARTGDNVIVLSQLDVQIDGAEPFVDDAAWGQLVEAASAGLVVD